MPLIKLPWTRKARPIEIQANGEVYSVIFSPDARHVVGGGQSTTVGHWQVDNGRAVGEPMEAGGYLLDVAFSKDGKLIVCGKSNGRAEVWDIKTHRKVVEAVVGAARVFAVDVSPDATRFVTGSGQDVAVWSVLAGQRLLGPFQHSDFVAAVKFSPSGDRIATATWEQNSIRLYDSSSGHLLVEIPDRVSSPYNTSLVWSHDGGQLFVASHSGKIKCFHVSGSFLSWMDWDIQTDTRPVSIALASNGKFIVAASSRFITFWDTATHSQIGPVIEQSERVWAVALSTNGYLASAGDDKKIIIRTLKNVLPRSYCANPADTLPEPANLSRTPIAQPSSLAETHRLETLLSERDDTISDLRKQNDNLEKTVHTHSTTLRTQEENLDQLKEQISNLKATVQGLRKQLSDARVTAQTLTKKLDETSEVANQHKLEVERTKAAFDEFKRATEHAAPQRSVAPSQNSGVGIDVFASWMRAHSITASTARAEETDDDSVTDYNALACSAFVQARSQNWSAAYEDAQKSVSLQPSAIGHIARTIAFIGQRDYKAAMRAFALVFRDGDPSENELMLVIWAVVSCLTGEHVDGIFRIHDLGHTETEKTTRICVQAYMYVLLGNKYMTEGDPERAIQLFNHARASYLLHDSSRLEIISLISGWSFDGLQATAQQHLQEALHAASRMKDPTTSVVDENNQSGRGRGVDRTPPSSPKSPLKRIP